MMWSIGRLRKGSRGFTFIELLMVILLLGLFAAMATPRFQNTYRELELSSQARSLAKFLTYAQERAVVEEKIYRFELDPVRQRYWLTVEAGEGEEGIRFGKIDGRYGRVTELPASISVSSSKEEILFHPDGSSDPFTLSLKNREGKELILKNGKPFGIVRIEETAKGSEGIFAF